MHISQQFSMHTQAWHEVAATSTSDWQAALAAQHAEEPRLLALRTAFEQWQEYIATEFQRIYLQHRYQQGLLQRACQLWAQLPTARVRLQRAEAAFTAIGTHLLKRWGLWAFMEHGCECKARQQLDYRRLYVWLYAWKTVTARQARHRRLLAARAVAREQRLMQRCFAPWLRLVVAAARQQMTSWARKLQVMSDAAVDNDVAATRDHVIISRITLHFRRMP